MKIAIIDPASFILPYDFFYISEIVKRNAVVDFYCSETDYNSEYQQELRNLGVNVYSYPISSTKANRITGMINYIKLLSFLYKNRNKYRAIHFQFFIFWPIEALFFLLIGKKITLSIHDDRPHDASDKPHKPTHLLASLAGRIVFISQAVYDRFLQDSKHPGYVQRKSIIVRHGLLPVFANDTNNYEVETFDGRVRFIGNVRPYKGIEFLADNLTNISSLFKLVVVGKWANELLYLQEKLKAFGAELVTGYIPLDEFRAHLIHDSIYILPYKRGTQSGVAYSLLNYSRVFVATNTGDLAEILKELGLTELLFEYGNSKQLMASLKFAKNNYTVIQEKIRQGRKIFSWENVIPRLELIYDPID